MWEVFICLLVLITLVIISIVLAKKDEGTPNCAQLCTGYVNSASQCLEKFPNDLMDKSSHQPSSGSPGTTPGTTPSTNPSTTQVTQEECLTYYGSSGNDTLMLKSSCDNQDTTPSTTQVTQEECLTYYGSSGDDTLMLKSSCDNLSNIQGYARSLGIESCSSSPSHGGTMHRINTRSNSNWAGLTDGQLICENISVDRERGLAFPQHCGFFYETTNHPEGVGRKCREYNGNVHSTRKCEAGDVCYR